MNTKRVEVFIDYVRKREFLVTWSFFSTNNFNKHWITSASRKVAPLSVERTKYGFNIIFEKPISVDLWVELEGYYEFTLQLQRLAQYFSIDFAVDTVDDRYEIHIITMRDEIPFAKIFL